MTESNVIRNRSSLPSELREAYGADLYRAIFRAEHPELVIRDLTPQAVYLALLGIGLESGHELIEVLPRRHYQIALDLHLWEKDGVSLDGFWQWLEVVDQEASLEPLGRFLAALDAKLLAVLFSKFVHAIVGEERTDVPPAEGYYTPDQGYTWVEIQIEDARKHRLFARLLAMLFQTDSPRFYQLLNESSAASLAELEEESFQEKNRRLGDEGFPDPETSARLQSPLTVDQFRALLAGSEREHRSGDGSFAHFLKNRDRLEPLSGVLEEVALDESMRLEVEAELSLIMNAALSSFLGGMSNTKEVEKQLAFVQATLNLGLERGCLESNLSPIELLRHLGLQPIYRLGLGEFRILRRELREILKMQTEEIADPLLRSLAAHLMTDEFPWLPLWLNQEEGVHTISQEENQFRPFRNLSDIAEVRQAFRQKLSH